MAKIVGINLVLISSAIITLMLSSWIPVSIWHKKPAIAIQEDVPFIKCKVCGALALVAYQLHLKVEENQAQFSPKKVTGYDDIIDTLEGICYFKNRESDWISYLDTIEVGDVLKLILHDSKGECSSKCKTIEMACQEILGYHDDIAEYIYKRKPSFESLLNFLCHDLTKSCSFPPPPVPKESDIDREIMFLEDTPGTKNQMMMKKSSPTMTHPKTSDLEL